MSVQTISIGRSILPSRATSLLLPPAAKPRNLRRAEFALIDALQALTCAGQGVLLLGAALWIMFQPMEMRGTMFLGI